ncbi:MAG: DUF5690 family protein [Myxococcales bacterium]|nr:DUF5690 family protein [Myxococcales bacterium]
MRERLTRALERAGTLRFSVFSVSAAFTAYFCMYGFRKPYAAAAFEGEGAFGGDLKIALVISQVLGYALSKYLGVRFVSELPPARRALALVSLIGVAELALVGVGALPNELKVVAIFFNGLPLGAVWGLVFGFLEGRRTTELLGAGLSVSYIVASGAVKTVGRWVIGWGVPEAWMPAVTGALFLLPFLVAVWLLSCLPAPDTDDEHARTRREPMDRAQRWAFFKRYAFGLGTLTLLYVLLTAYRDFRDNFAFEIWSALGYAEEPEVMTLSELPIALFVLLCLGLIYVVRENRRAFFLVHGLMLAGSVLIGVATLAFQVGALGGGAWMVLVGAGLYLGYVPFGSVLFDRLMAMTRHVGTAVFMIYVTDAAGYAGSVALLLLKNSDLIALSWLPFFIGLSYATAVGASVGFALSWAYFARQPAARPA